MNLETPNAEDVPVRDAATVMLLRNASDARSGFEVAMLRRNLQSDFVGGAYVFPGGGVDPGDTSVDYEHICVGRADADASAQVDVHAGGLAFWVAAVRESFEESGVLLAVHREGGMIDLDDPTVAMRFAEHRRAVDSGERSLGEICQEESLVLTTDRMHYFSRWITPLGAPRRYDTRFFVAHAPEGQEPVHDDREVISSVWVSPAVALEKHAAGEFDLIFPTVRTLESLVQFDSADAVIDHAASMSGIDPILPRVVVHASGLRIVLPDDHEYDAVTSRLLN